jgi:hypothetical protein
MIAQAGFLCQLVDITEFRVALGVVNFCVLWFWFLMAMAGKMMSKCNFW